MSKLKDKKVLVTGATGFVGAHLTRKLLSFGAQVSIFVRPSSDKKIVSELERFGANVIFGDISNSKDVFDAVFGNEYVFHIAALFRQAKHPPEIYHQVNVEGTRHILDAAEKFSVKRVIHCSTVGVHSHIPNPPASEDEPYRPADIYQHTKCEGEKLAKS